ncbi:ERF family protein [Streptomyces syringium]|uniref:ERF family protein n=1 Tax=Streptomyces syringium TaxID=76729 RepID=UPI0033C1A368
MTSLAERAAAAAGRAETAPADEPGAAYVPPSSAPETGVPLADMGQYEPGDDDPPMIPVHLAWLRVRKDVRAISKGEQYNAAGTRYNFRGVDTTINAFAPVTLRHGVNVLPVAVNAVYSDAVSKGGSKMRECRVTVTWQVTGPMGDSLPLLQSAGEALDSQDKGTAKAQSVAYRVLLLTAGMTPTNDPEPELQAIERGDAPVRPAVQYLDEICHPDTSAARLRQIHHELRTTRQLGALVTNEIGEEEAVGDMVVRIGRERAGAPDVR